MLELKKRTFLQPSMAVEKKAQQARRLNMAPTISASMIKELRERTGVGMGKCKEALEEAQGDMELAISNLRKSGMATAVKKEGRSANEGMIASAEKGDIVA